MEQDPEAAARHFRDDGPYSLHGSYIYSNTTYESVNESFKMRNTTVSDNFAENLCLISKTVQECAEEANKRAEKHAAEWERLNLIYGTKRTAAE